MAHGIEMPAENLRISKGLAGKRRTGVCRHRKLPPDKSRTIDGTGRTTPVRARRNGGGKESTD
jgi:hypothetical protein